jgi:hypothetical protein
MATKTMPPARSYIFIHTLRNNTTLLFKDVDKFISAPDALAIEPPPKSCRMNKASAPELQLHFTILERKKNALSIVTNQYSEHLLECIHQWYGTALYDDPSLAYEAVYESLRYYTEHPRNYNPQHGCLVRFLELHADRCMQTIFGREKINIQIKSVDRHLARFFDNELDVQLAKMIIKKNADFSDYVILLDIGSYRIAEQVAEISRHTDRIRKTLGANFNNTFSVRRRVKHNAPTVHFLLPHA